MQYKFLYLFIFILFFIGFLIGGFYANTVSYADFEVAKSNADSTAHTNAQESCSSHRDKEKEICNPKRKRRRWEEEGE